MPQDHDNQSSSPGKNVSPGDHHDALTITHTPTTISIVPTSADVGEITLPRSIGNVTIQGEIGRGGMGVVFHGRDAVLHRAVAVKFLLTVATQKDDPQFNRFFGGARAEAAVKHPNIVTVYEAGQVGGVPYLVMEFIDGPSLHALIRPSRRLPLPVAVKVLWDVAQAVGALHERDIIHRDLKPGNVLFDRTGHLFVTDFGLASLRRRIDDPTEAAGTPAYMAPETFTGRASPQSDVYAMGCMLFELLTGRLPFTGDVKSIREQHSSAPLPVDQLPASTPSSLVDVIERATHKKEVFRYRRAEQFQRALQDGVATHELLREGAERLATLVLTQHEEVSNDSGVTVSETPSTGTYFERLSDLASKKRDTPTHIDKSEPSSEQVDQESADQVAEPEVLVRRDPIPIDLTCATCAYNLRGLLPDSQCPECGTSVSVSLQPDRLVFADPKWLTSVAKGLQVIQWSLSVTVAVLLGLTVAIVLWRASSKILPGTRTVVHRFEAGTATGSYNVFVDFAFFALLACSIGAIMTGVLLATRRPTVTTNIAREEATRRASRVLAAVCALVAVALLICFDLVRTTVHKHPNGVSLGPVEPVLYAVLMVSTAIALACLVPVFLRWLNHLIRRLPHARLSRHSVIQSAAFATLIVLALGFITSDRLWSLFRPYILGWFLMNVAGIFVLLLFTRRALQRVIPNCVSYHEHFGGPVDTAPKKVLVAVPSVESGRSGSARQEDHSPTEQAASSSTYPASTIESSETQPVPTLWADVPCMQCDYNLRGLTAGGRCPECGAAVTSSLGEDRLLFAEPSWLRQIARGLTVLYAVVVATPVIFIVSVPVSLLLFGSVSNVAIAGGVAGVVLIVGLVLGAFLATASEPRRTNGTIRWSSRRLVRTLGVLFPLSLAAVALTAGYSPVLLIISLGLMWATLMGMLATFLLYLATLAERIPKARLVRQARGLAIAVGTVPVIGAVAGVAGFGLGNAFPTLTWYLAITLIICILGSVATAGLFMGLMRIYRKAVNRVIAAGVSLDTLFGDVATKELLGSVSSQHNRGRGSPARGAAILAPIRFVTRPIMRRVNRYLEPPEAELFPTKEVRAVAMRRIGYALLKSWRFWLEMLTLCAASALAINYLWMLQEWMRLERYAPTWLMGLVLVLVVGNVLALWFVRRRLPRRVRAALLECGIPVCMKCGYDLRGQTFPRCPECGREFDETLLLQRRESPDGMQSGGPVSSVSATSKAATSDRTPNLIDIPLDGYLATNLTMIVFFAGLLLVRVGIILARKAAADGRSELWVWVLGVAILGFVAAVYWVAQRLMQRHVRSITVEVEQRGVSAVAQGVMSYAFRRKGHRAPALLVKELVKQRRLGSTIRVCPEDQVVRIDPIDVPFEPVMLDEADTAFMGLLGTAAIGSGDSDAANESQALRRVRRNLSMKGGWVVAVGFSVGLVASVYGAIRNRQFNWQILIFAVGMASVFLEPAGWFRSMRKQWLLVPRGLVLRKAGGRKGGWKVHLFERDRSVLCVCRHDKRKWRFFVADAEKSESLLTTKQEIDVLLAAWLSPLDAPSPDRLTDLS